MNHEFDVEKLISNLLDQPYTEVDWIIKETVIKALLNKDTIIAAIEDHLTKWKFERINRLAQAIMIQAAAQYRFVEQIDRSIVISNAVQLAKKYLDDGDYKLINAVLDKAL